MTIKCLVIDDEPLALKVMESHIAKIPDIELVASLEDPLEAIEILKHTAIDLIFLDIEMPVLTGIEFIKTLEHPPGIIFTTAYRNYAIESYELNIIDYLLKPIAFARFMKAVIKFRGLAKIPNQNISTQESTTRNDHLYVKANRKFVKIQFDEILYVESLKDYIRIHFKDKNIITKDTISNFENMLPGEFLRIHRSFIVNITKLTAFTKVDVEIGEKEIPIGASYKERTMEYLREG